MNVFTAARICGSSWAYVLIGTPCEFRSGTLLAGEPASDFVGASLFSPRITTTSAVAPPSSLDFSAFVEVLTTTGRNSIPMSILNSVIITAGAIFGLVLFGSVAAYVIARRTRRWTTFTYYLVLIAIILPAQLGTVNLAVHRHSETFAEHDTGDVLLGRLASHGVDYSSRT